MGKTNRKKLLCALLGLLITATVTAPVLSARSRTVTDPTVLSETDPRVMTAVLDVSEDDFNHPTVDWNLTGGMAEAVTAIEAAPYTVYEGSRSLLVTATGEALPSVTLTRTVKTAVASQDLHWLAVALYVVEGEAPSVTLSVTSAGGTYEKTYVLMAARWQTVFFPLTDGAVHGKISRLSLTVTAEAQPLTFLVDTVGASTRETAVREAKYLSAAYRSENCLLDTDETAMTVTFEGAAAPSIEAETPIVTDFSGGVGLKVRLENRSDIDSLTLRYTTLANPLYTEAQTVTVPIPKGDGAVSCLFPIPVSYIGRYQLVFDGATEGSLSILSVTVAPCYAGAATVGTVSECRIAHTKKTVSIRGSLPAAAASLYAECNLYLYELSLFEEVSSITLASPVKAETVLNGSNFSFSIPLSEDRGELFRKYAVMIYDAGSLIPVGTPCAITNPELLAVDTEAMAVSSIKGTWPLDSSGLFDGLSHTAVDIRLDRLLSLSEDTVAHTVGEYTVTVDRAYLHALDAEMERYEACGIGVTFILRLALPDDPSLSSLLCHPLTEGGRYAALPTHSAEGIALLRTVVDLLVRRYATKSGVSENLVAITVGSAVNEAYENYNLGTVTLSSFAKQYGNALRTVYNAAKAVAAGVRVCLPLGGSWYRAMTIAEKGSFDASTALTAVAAYLSAGGDIDWTLAYDICPGNGVYAWEQTPDISSETVTVTAANLEVLLDCLSESRMLYDGSSRELLLLETEPHEALDENDRICLSADYVYTYLRLSSREMKSVIAYLPAHPVDYGATLKYIDTNHFAQATAYAVELIGSERFQALLPDAVLAVNRYLHENAAFAVVPSSVKGQTALFDFSADTDGWRRSLYCAAIRGGVSLEGQSGFLSLRLAEAPVGAWCGAAVSFAAPLDLSVAPYIGFALRTAVLPEGVEELEVAVVMMAGANRQISTMTVPAGEEATVVIDLSAFPARSLCDGMAVYVRGIGEQTLGEATVILGSVRAMSEDRSDNDLNDVLRNPMEAEEETETVSLATVVTVGAVGLFALILEVGRVIVRYRKNKEDETDPMGE